MQALIDLCRDGGSAVVRTGACKYLGETVALYALRPQLPPSEELHDAYVMYDDCRGVLLRGSPVPSEEAGAGVCKGAGVDGMEMLSMHLSRLIRSAIDGLLDNLALNEKLVVSCDGRCETCMLV